MKRNPKNENQISGWNYFIIIIAMMTLLVGIVTIQAGSKNIPPAAAENEISNSTSQNAESPSKLTVWNIIQMTDWLFWPFTLITAVGIMLIIYFALVELQDKSRSRILLESEIQPTNIRHLLQLLQAGKTSRASWLLNQMIVTYNKTSHAEPIANDVSRYLTGERESFETFNRVSNFLSDSAGALGLLGTVWGIFQTFHAGRLDGPTILQGMSISLVTTLVGLIISLFLTMGATYVFTIFNEQLKSISAKAEQLRQALLFLEKKSNGFSRTDQPELTPNLRPQPASRRKPRVEPVAVAAQEMIY